MSASKQIINKHEQMFYPTVRVRTNKSGGSGTVVYSKKHDGEAYTYVVTNHHVVDNCIKIVKKWNPIKKKLCFHLSLLLHLHCNKLRQKLNTSLYI